jgi:hypothetical protein
MAFMLAACGGGGGGGGGTDPAASPPPAPVPAPAPAPAPGPGGSAFMQGVLVGSPFMHATEYDSAELALASGQLAGLPRSAWSSANRAEPDQWAINASTGSTADLVRQDWVGNIEFFDRKTLARTGGFFIGNLPNTNQPRFYSIAKPSPDGQHVLAYWKADYHDDQPVLAVFDRAGNVVQQGISIAYDASLYWNAFDWLPDGRYLFLAGTTLAIGTVGSSSFTTIQVTPPSGVGTGGAEMSVSPDGTKIAWKLAINLPDQNGIEEGRGVLFISDTQAGTFRQLTTLSSRAQASDGEIAHSNAVWSPDGQYLAFSIAYPQNGLAIPTSECPAELVLPVSSPLVAIDGLNDPASEHFQAVDPSTGKTTAVQSCFQQVSWFAP